jgi:hypothetical protein
VGKIMEPGKQFKHLFHGTVHPFKEGDMITPQGDEPYAWATPDKGYAQDRARDSVNYSWEANKKKNPDWNTPGGKQYKEYRAETPPRVYQVEGLGDESPHPDNPSGIYSKKGFRVVKQVE